MEGKPPQRNLLRYATVGMEFFLTFVMFLGMGWLVDGWVGWPGQPFAILGGIVGFAVGMYRLVHQGWGILKDSSVDFPEDLERKERERQTRQGRPDDGQKNRDGSDAMD